MANVTDASDDDISLWTEQQRSKERRKWIRKTFLYKEKSYLRK